MNRSLAALVLLLAGLAGGCVTPPDTATQVKLETEARVTRTVPRRQTFSIVPGPRSQWGESDLNYKWIEANLVFALTARGYQLGSSNDDCDLLIILNPSVASSPIAQPAPATATVPSAPRAGGMDPAASPPEPATHYRFSLGMRAYDMVEYRTMTTKERNDGAKLLWEVQSTAETDTLIAENEVFARLAEVAAANIGADSVPPAQILSRERFLAIRRPVSAYSAR